MAPPASGPMTRSNSVKNAAIVQEAGAGEEDGEDDAPPAVDSRFSESTSDEDLEAEDTSGPALNIVMKLMAIISLVFCGFFCGINDGQGIFKIVPTSQ